MNNKSSALLVGLVLLTLILTAAFSAISDLWAYEQAINRDTFQPGDINSASSSLPESRDLAGFSKAPIYFSEYQLVPYDKGATSIYAADLDGDNDNDIVGASFRTDEIVWWENDNYDFSSKHVIASPFGGADHISAVDLNKDTHIDILGSGFKANEIAWWQNDGTPGNGGWSKHTVVSNFFLARDSQAIDFDGDTNLDIVGASGTGEIAWWKNDGTPLDGGWSKFSVTKDFRNVMAIYAVDLNGDTFIDIVGVEAGEFMGSNGRVAWWQNDGSPEDGGWIQHILSDNFSGGTDVHAVDLDGDLDMDIVAVGAFQFGFTWWENKGGSSFTQHSMTSAVDYAQAVTGIDLDSDGDVDVVSPSITKGVVWWENDGDQNFDEHIISKNLTYVSSAHVIDLDKDLDLDIIGSGRVDSQSEDYITWWKQQIEQFAYLPVIDGKPLPTPVPPTPVPPTPVPPTPVPCNFQPKSGKWSGDVSFEVTADRKFVKNLDVPFDNSCGYGKLTSTLLPIDDCTFEYTAEDQGVTVSGYGDFTSETEVNGTTYVKLPTGTECHESWDASR